MTNNQNLELALKIKALVEGAKNILGLNNEINSLRGQAAKPIPDPTPEMRKGADSTSAAVGALKNQLTGLVGIAAIKQFVDASVNEFARAEMAYRGLEAVANFTGEGIGKALAAVKELTGDGLVPDADISKSMQNLLQFGFSVDQAKTLLIAFKDAAAFNRVSHLSMGEAIASATEGIKNENSTLIDNVGLTKNAAKIYAEFADQTGKSVQDLTNADKIQAFMTIGLKELAAQSGNAAKALEGYQVQVAKADAEQRKFMASLGQLFVPLITGLLPVGTWLIENVAKPLAFFFASIGADLRRDIEYLRIWKDAVLNLDFSNVSKQVEEADKKHEEALTKLAGNLNGVSFEPIGESAKKAAQDTAAATGDMGKSVKQLAKEQKDAVKEQIKDYERLRDSLIKAFDDSFNTQRDYLAQAKKLRAEATATPRDDSDEGQASALLDLIAAEQALSRIRGSAPLEDVKAQVELVKDLAAGIDDQARAQEAINRAKLAEADALERAAAAEGDRQAEIAAQQKANEERLISLQAILKDLEAGKKVNLDLAEATTAVQQVKAIWDGIQDKTVNLTVKQNGAAAAVPGFASGGILPGYGGGDRRMILAEDGEAITNKRAVAYYGRDFMAALNNMSIPRFASGGFVERVAAAPVSHSGSGLQPVILKIEGRGEYPMMARQDIAKEVESVLNRASLKRGRRV